MIKNALSALVVSIAFIGVAFAASLGGAGNENVTRAKMFVYESAVATVIHDTDVYQALHGIFSDGDTNSNGWSFSAGNEGIITTYADAGGGQVTVTSATHGLSTGDYITISNTTNYNGAFQVANALTNTFEITDTWVADDAQGNWEMGDQLIAGNNSAGWYHICYNMSSTSAGNNKNYRFELMKNTTMLDQSASERRIGVAGDWGVLAGCEIEQIAVGDVLSYLVKNTTDSTDMTVRHANVNLHKLN